MGEDSVICFDTNLPPQPSIAFRTQASIVCSTDTWQILQVPPTPVSLFSTLNDKDAIKGILYEKERIVFGCEDRPDEIHRLPEHAGSNVYYLADNVVISLSTWNALLERVSALETRLAAMNKP